jgi:pyruvate-formate lyase-activating enzyme
MGAITLLVPHYMNEEEVSNIAKFIAGLDDTIPYNLLIFTYTS